MITSLKLQNFQSHENSKLDFVDGLNVIVGRSDSGKSALIRALRWNRWNKPSGSSMRSSWGGPTITEVDTKEGAIIRIKDKKDQYVLRRRGEGDTLFEAFGTSVPEEIASFLNVDEVNLQLQLDSHFLLSKNPGQVAEHYNQVANIDQINRGRENINKAIRTLSTTIKYKEEDIKSTKEEIKEFDYLDLFEADVEVLEEMEKNVSILQIKYEQLQNLVSKLVNLKKQILQISKDIRMEPEVDDLIQVCMDKEKLEREEMLLNRAVTAIVSTNVRLKRTEAKQTQLLAEFEENFPNVCPLCGSQIKK
jgi:exonuclease SbcC